MHARFPRSLTLVAVLAVPLATHPPLAAQSPDQRTSFVDAATAIDGLVAPATLDSISRFEPSSQGSSPEARLRRALVDARLGEVTGDLRRFRDARDGLADVVRNRASWAEGWYALGRTRLKMSQSRLRLPAAGWESPDSTDAGKSVAALTRALAADSTFQPAAATLARARIEQQAAPLLDTARALRDRGETDSAVRLIHRYLTLGADSGIGYLELASALATGDRAAEAVEAHGVAVEHATSPAAIGRLRRELVWIADSAELAEFDHLSAAGRVAWVDAFWERRDVRDARRPDERLVEHLRRVAYAEREFRKGTSRRFAVFGDSYRGPPSDLDDRAVIYIRHGPPDERAFFSGGFKTKENLALVGGMDPETGITAPRVSEHTADIPPNTSWKYRRPDGDLIFHFVARGGGNDYRLVESLLDVFSPDSAIAIQSGQSKDWGAWSGPGYDETQYAIPLFESRAGLDPVYAELSAGTGLRATRRLARERESGRRWLAAGTTTDSYRLVHKAWMPAVVQCYGLTNRGGGRALVVFAVPAVALSDPIRTDTAGRLYPLQFRIVLSTPGDRRIAQLDTVRAFTVHRELGDRDYLTGYFELPTPAGRQQARLVVVSPGGDVAGSAPAIALDVPPPAAAGRLTLSDIVLGSERSSLAWPGPDGPVPLNPLGAYRKGADAQVYYQIGGLERGESIRTTIDIAPADTSRRVKRAASTFTARAGAAWQSERREIGLGGLKPGVYVLSVTVATEGERVTRTATVYITKR